MWPTTPTASHEMRMAAPRWTPALTAESEPFTMLAKVGEASASVSSTKMAGRMLAPLLVVVFVLPVFFIWSPEQTRAQGPGPGLGSCGLVAQAAYGDRDG